MKKATTNETTFICVKPIIKAECTIRIVGDSPLLVHAWSEKAKKEMLQAQQGKKLLKKDKVAKNPAGECAEALYWLDGKPDVAYSTNFMSFLATVWWINYISYGKFVNITVRPFCICRVSV